jgi:hypothetical protein
MLNPSSGNSNFKDLAGNLLPIGAYSGQFVTSGGSSNPNQNCQPEDVTDIYGYSVAKMVQYRQSSVAAATENPTGIFFFCSVLQPTNIVLQSAKLEVPSSSVKTCNLQNSYGGIWMFSEPLSSQSLLDASYPAGMYKITVSSSSGNQSAQVNMPNMALTPIPHFSNYTEAQSIDPAADFTLQWDAFNSTSTNDMQQIEISDENNTMIFFAPNDCAGIDLPLSKHSIVLTNGLLKAGKTYTASLQFYHFETSSAALFSGQGMGGSVVARMTEMVLKTKGGTEPNVNPPRFLSIRTVPNNNIQIQISATAGKNLILETSPALGSNWTTLLTTNSPTGEINIQLERGKVGFFRAKH